MRFSRRALLARSRSSSVPIDCTLADTAGAAAGVAAGAATGAAGAGSSLPEQAARATSRANGASRRSEAIVLTCDIQLPFEYDGT